MKAVPWALIAIVTLAAFLVWHAGSIREDCVSRGGTIQRVGNGHICLSDEGRVLETYR